MPRKLILFFFAVFLSLSAMAQSVDSAGNDLDDRDDAEAADSIAVDSPAHKKKLPVSVSGMAEVSYEHYGLDVDPSTYRGIRQRKPWNQVRFNIQPTIKFGNDWTLPLNISFAALPTNAAGPYAGLRSQTFGQWLTNPLNNLGVSPKYKWAQLLLGTQYIKYSDLSTGDIGVFGAGFDLRPKGFLVKFFAGRSQQGINYVAPAFPTPPGVQGAYRRTHYMFQLGKEKEGKYMFALNFSKGKDDSNSVSSRPVSVTPQEGFVASVMGDVHFLKKWFVRFEAAQSYFTNDIIQPVDTERSTTLKPFIDGHLSTRKDNAANFSVGRKSENFDIGYTTKYIGQYFQTTGYPYMQPDHWDNTLDTRFNAWKKKMNVVGSVGIRTNNINNSTLRSNQFIGNVNWFTQFNDHFSLNLNYNNFGFRSVGGINPYGIKNVSNDFGVSPTYTWSTNTMTNIIAMSYNYSKYDERDVMTGITTSNNTHTALLSYIPTFFNNDITPEFSAMYFRNTAPFVQNTLLTLSGGAGYPVLKKKIQLRLQLQYTMGQLNTYTANNNFVASLGVDYKITKKLTWKNYFSTNHFRYGNELTTPTANLDGVRYLETNIRTSLQYKF